MHMHMQCIYLYMHAYINMCIYVSTISPCLSGHPHSESLSTRLTIFPLCLCLWCFVSQFPRPGTNSHHSTRIWVSFWKVILFPPPPQSLPYYCARQICANAFTSPCCYILIPCSIIFHGDEI
jgi:hypothetical protein